MAEKKTGVDIHDTPAAAPSCVTLVVTSVGHDGPLTKLRVWNHRNGGRAAVYGNECGGSVDNCDMDDRASFIEERTAFSSDDHAN